MGLKINLYKSESWKDYKNRNRLAEENARRILKEESGKLGKLVADLSEEERYAINKKVESFYEENDYDIYGEDTLYAPNIICSDSSIDKEHDFKLGYFISSYNKNSFNNLLPQLLGQDENLYSILEKKTEEYYERHDWNTCLNNVNRVISLFEDKMKKGMHKAIPHSISIFMDENEIVDNPCKALEVFEAEGEVKGNYSKKAGTFYEKPLEVTSFIEGKLYGKDTLFAIVEASDEEKQWFLIALKIVKETIEYVLNSNEPENFLLGWGA